MISKVYHPKHLPNKAGFKFIALVRDSKSDSFHPAQVCKNETTGCHYVSGTTSAIEYKNIIGWLKVGDDGNPVYLR